MGPLEIKFDSEHGDLKRSKNSWIKNSITIYIRRTLQTILLKFFGAIFRKNTRKMRRRWRGGVPRTNRTL